MELINMPSVQPVSFTSGRASGLADCWFEVRNQGTRKSKTDCKWMVGWLIEQGDDRSG